MKTPTARPSGRTAVRRTLAVAVAFAATTALLPSSAVAAERPAAASTSSTSASSLEGPAPRAADLQDQNALERAWEKIKRWVTGDDDSDSSDEEDAEDSTGSDTSSSTSSGETAAAPVGADTRVMTAEGWVDSIGVGTHATYLDRTYGSVDWPQLVIDTGITHVRDGQVNDEALAAYKELGQAGVDLNWVTQPVDGASVDEQVATIKEAIADGAPVTSVEGVNENDNRGDDGWADKVRANQKQLYAAVKAELGEDVPVVAPSLVFDESREELGAVPSDVGNSHGYTGGKQQTGEATEHQIDMAKTLTSAVDTSAPVSAGTSGDDSSGDSSGDGAGRDDEPTATSTTSPSSSSSSSTRSSSSSSSTTSSSSDDGGQAAERDVPAATVNPSSTRPTWSTSEPTTSPSATPSASSTSSSTASDAEGPTDTAGAKFTLKDAVEAEGAVWVTETGFHTATDSQGGGGVQPYVSEDAQAVLQLQQAFLDYANGVDRTYFYELLDEGSNNAEAEDRFGMFHADGSPKPVATALKNAIATVKSGGPSGTAGAAAVGVQVSGGSDATTTLTLPRADGSTVVVVWEDSSVWDADAEKAVDVPEQKVTLDLDQSADVEMFVPGESAKAISSQDGTDAVSLTSQAAPTIVVLSAGRGASSTVSTASKADQATVAS